MRDGRRDNDGGASGGGRGGEGREGKDGERTMLFALIIFNSVRVNSNGMTQLNFFVSATKE